MNASDNKVRCCCGETYATYEEVLAHIKLRRDAGDLRYYADGGHAVDMRTRTRDHIDPTMRNPIVQGPPRQAE